MSCERFIYTLTNDSYKLVASKNAEKLLSEEHFQKVCNIGCGVKKEQTVEMWFPDEKVYTLSLIQPTKDKYMREGFWNYTILVKVTDFLPKLLSGYLIRKTAVLPSSLEPLKVNPK